MLPAHRPIFFTNADLGADVSHVAHADVGAIDPLVRDAIRLLNGNDPAAVSSAQRAYELALSNLTPTDPVVMWSLGVFEQIGARFAQQDAVRDCYRRLGARLTAGDDKTLLTLIEVQRRLGDFEARNDRLDVAAHSFDIALKLADSVREMPSVEALSLRLNAALVHARKGDPVRAAAFQMSALQLYKALEANGAPDDLVVSCRQMLSYAEACFEYGQLTDAGRAYYFVTDVIDRVTSAGSEMGVLKARASIGQALLNYQQGQGAICLMLLQVARAALDTLPAEEPERELVDLECKRVRAFALIGVGRLELAREATAEFVDSIDRASHIAPSARASFLLSAVDAQIELLEVPAAQELLAKLDQRIPEDFRGSLQAMLDARKATCAFYSGNLHQALGFLDAALADNYTNVLSKEFRSTLLMRRSDVRLLLEDGGSALTDAKMAVGVLELPLDGALPAPNTIVALAYARRAMLGYLLGDHESAELFFDRAGSMLPLNMVVGEATSRAAYFSALGVASVLRGKFAAGAGRFVSASAILSKFGMDEHPRMLVIREQLQSVWREMGYHDKVELEKSRIAALQARYPGMRPSLLF
ncbi:MAG: hypothetical protein K1X79_03875 [Oligoflexia bacterium]|nr:hypothetical protein [Oligoflexia bacterium]